MIGIQKARELAFRYHKERKYGEFAYVSHLQSVALAVRDFIKEDDRDFELCEKLTIVAWLHDIIEDTTCTFKEIYDKFGLEIANAVLSLTKLENQSYDEYIQEIRSNDLALKVKIADTYCNLTQSLIDGNNKRIVKYSEQLRRLIE